MIAVLASRSTGPRRLRAQLARKTRPLRRSRWALASVRHLRGELPSTLLGSELWDVFSDRLRELLEEPAYGDVVSPVSRSTEAPTALAPTVNPSRRIESVPGTRPTGTRPVAVQPPGRLVRPLTSSSTAALTGTSEVDFPAHTTQVKRAVQLAVPDEVTQAPAGWRAQAIDRAPRDTPVFRPPSLLRRRINAYIATAAEAVPAQPPEAPDQSSDRPGRGGLPPVQWHRPAAGPAWPELAGADVGARLRSWREQSRPRRAAIRSDEIRRPEVSIRNAFHVSIYGDQPQSTRELSDRVAAILREQALQHGIDIT